MGSSMTVSRLIKSRRTMNVSGGVVRCVTAAGKITRTFWVRRECETNVCHHTEESYPCKAEQRNNSYEEVSRF